MKIGLKLLAEFLLTACFASQGALAAEDLALDQLLRSANQLESELEKAVALYGETSAKACNGRITTESGVPISTTDRAAQSTVYFTPYKGGVISLYDGSAYWKTYALSEISIALSGLTNARNYDVFVYNNSGSPALELAIWTSNTARASALELQDGVYVKSADKTRRYVGTIRTTSTTTTEDSLTNRLVYNYCNRVLRPFAVTEATASWAYTTATLRPTNNTTANAVGFVIGAPTGDAYLISATAHSMAISNNDLALQSGLGVNSTTATSATQYGASGASGYATQIRAHYHESVNLNARYSYLQWLESGNTGCTMYGTAGDASGRVQTGLVGFLEM